MPEKVTIDRQAFERWLDGLPGNHLFSNESPYARNCPLAAYLRVGKGLPVSVGCTAILFLEPGCPVQRLPAWAEDFVKAYDRSQSLDLSVQRVRAVLRAIPKEPTNAGPS